MRITADNVCKRFGREAALVDLSFDLIGPGVTALMGENGVGKSVFLKILAGTLAPDRGSARLTLTDSGEALDPATSTRAREVVGYQSDHAAYWPEDSVLETLVRVARMKTGVDAEPALSVDKLRLEKVLTKTVKHLSLGYMRRLALACALIGNPLFLFLDEPTNGLDPVERDIFWRVMRTESKEKRVVFATHLPEEAAALAGDAIVLKEGRIAYRGECDARIGDLYRRVYV